jgi:predicted transcriptional regulator
MGTTPKTVTRTFRLPAKLADKLDQIADASDDTTSDIVVDALTLHFDQFVEADPAKVADLLAEIRASDHARAANS